MHSPTARTRPARAIDARPRTLVENGTTCCYAQQDKVWVHGPGQEPWEVYTVTGDSATFSADSADSAGSAASTTPDTCCPTRHR